MRRLWLAVLGASTVALLAGVAAADEVDREATLLEYVEVWNSGELDRLDTLVTADFRRHGGPGEGCASRQDLKALIGRTREIFDHVRLTVADHMVDRGGGAMRGSFYGVHTEIDRVVEFEMMSMYRFEDGLLAEEWTLGNNFLVLVGLGYQLTPPGFEVVEAPRQEPQEER